MVNVVRMRLRLLRIDHGEAGRLGNIVRIFPLVVASRGDLVRMRPI